MVGSIPLTQHTTAPSLNPPAHKKRTIIVDIGHGTHITDEYGNLKYTDKGAQSRYASHGLLQEHTVVQPAANAFTNQIVALDMADGVQDYTIIYTQPSQTIEERKRLKERYPDAVFVSFHANKWQGSKKTSTQTAASGMEVYGFSDGGEAVAESISEKSANVCRELYKKPASVRTDQAFRVITVPDYDGDGIDGKHKDFPAPGAQTGGTVVTGDADDNARDFSVLVELGYLDNPNDANVLANPKAMTQLGSAIADGVHEFIQSGG